MAATQSHAFRYDGVAVERHAQLGGALKLVPRVLPVIAYMFSSVIMGILYAALAEGRRRLQPRAERMSAFERVSWTKAVNDIWLAEQAFEGMARAIESGAASPGVPRGKLAIAELAEASLLSDLQGDRRGELFPIEFVRAMVAGRARTRSASSTLGARPSPVVRASFAD